MRLFKLQIEIMKKRIAMSRQIEVLLGNVLQIEFKINTIYEKSLIILCILIMYTKISFRILRIQQTIIKVIKLQRIFLHKIILCHSEINSF